MRYLHQFEPGELEEKVRVGNCETHMYEIAPDGKVIEHTVLQPS
jgi:hypothetical protein